MDREGIREREKGEPHEPNKKIFKGRGNFGEPTQLLMNSKLKILKTSFQYQKLLDQFDLVFFKYFIIGVGVRLLEKHLN
jgi:hypothetical protein